MKNNEKIFGFFVFFFGIFQLITNRDALAKELISPSDLYSSESFSVLVAAGTGAIQQAHVQHYLNYVYPNHPDKKYEAWSCGDIDWQGMWTGINNQLLLYV